MCETKKCCTGRAIAQCKARRAIKRGEYVPEAGKYPLCKPVGEAVEKLQKEAFERLLKAHNAHCQTAHDAWERIRPLKVLLRVLAENADPEESDIALSHLAACIVRLEHDFRECAEYTEDGQSYDLLKGEVIEEALPEENEEDGEKKAKG